MRLWDLSAPAAKLELALKSLNRSTAEIGEGWTDDAYEQFNETYVIPLEPRVRAMLDAIGRLAEVLSNAERQCRDE